MARAAGLNAGAIVAAALGIADREGIAALTMRRLSAELRVTPMAIYHHVEGKDALLDLVIDQSLGGLPDINPRKEPRRQLGSFFLALHQLLVEHPALAHAMATRPLEGPIATAKAEQAFAALRRLGHDADAVVEVFVSAFSYALGASLYRISRGEARADRAFPEIDEQDTPTAHALRDQLTSCCSNDIYVLRGLDKLLT